ncbi:ribonuclease H-like YkuK family protein [Taibaiella koreensis]|uniref:ribonuclease H-like YkuK family protein n=1 Tax=Taibaiella koreensis TaxID=1268548 RepID=UPI000E59DCAB|nr:ribonuclease H-like YkuK family protein [Taibaiella koreensis]
METKTLHWRKLAGHQVRRPIEEEIQQAIVREHAGGYRLKACIGTDSQVKGKRIECATVIVLLREGRGGFMYIHKEVLSQTMSIRERMLHEVARSVEVAYSLCEVFNEFDVAMEVHADINTDPGFKSHVALKDAMGYITGMGFAFRAKPHAFASTSCANKIVH